jgi:hypothetical protein
MRRIPELSCILCLFFFMFTAVPELAAQSGGYAGSFSRIGFSPRGMAMGNALTAVESEGVYGYYNPALAATPSESMQIDLATASLRFDRQLHMVSSHFRLPPSAGFSVSLINAKVSNIDGRTQSGYHTGYLSTTELQLIGNFAIRFSEKFWGGIGLKYNFSNLHVDIPNSSTVGLDAGIRLQISGDLSLAFTMKDLLSEQKLNTSELYGAESADMTDRYPVRFHSGLSYNLTENWLIAMDYEIRFQTEYVLLNLRDDTNTNNTSGTIREKQSSQSHYLRVGSRFNIHERITIRGGVQYFKDEDAFIFQPGAGFSLHLPYDRFAPSIDYAILKEPSLLSTMHVFAIRLNI